MRDIESIKSGLACVIRRNPTAVNNPMVKDLREVVEEVEHLQTALTAWDMDPHHYSKRPCGTCQQISDALGKPFGCIRYALTGEPYVKAAVEAEENKR